ncbi:MAG: GHKL domain-containing protein, partial [Patescibacteria group bacterium]|nr:GHKL domain-containing protein [Patescibacteria group bacterium]
YAGIYLYRDGAWMKPYGGLNDWLGLESRRVQRRSKVGNTQVFGIVHTNQEENPHIRPTAHREVLQDNDAFHDLKMVLLDVIADLENYREEKKAKVDKPVVKTEVMAENNISQITKLCKGKDELTRNDIQKILQHATATEKYLEQVLKEKDEEIEDLAELRQHELSLLALGLVASYVAHQVSEPLDKNIKILNEAKKLMESMDFSKPMPEENVKQGQIWLQESQKNTEKIMHFMSWVDEFSHHISKSVSSGGKTRQVQLEEIWNFVVRGLKDTMDFLQITPYFYDQPEHLKIRINPIDLESILSNLAINSIDALKDRKEGNKIIRLEASYKDAGLVLKFSDNGPGVQFKKSEEIFVPFVTSHRTGDTITHGHGLGLPVVREILRRYEGSIELAGESHFKPGATFVIKLPASTVKRVV